MRSSGLDASDLALLQALLPAAISADPGGKRRLQLVGNATLEFRLTVSAAALRGLALLDPFLASPEFHAAIAEDGRLPLAFAAFAQRRIDEERERVPAGVLALELALAELRRYEPASTPGGESRGDTVRLAPRATLIHLPDGTLDWCQALQVELGRSTPTPPAGYPGSATETVLLFARPPFSPHRAPDVRSERLAPPADELFQRLHELGPRGMDADERAAFAAAMGAAPEDLDGFLAGFLAEGAIERG